MKYAFIQFILEHKCKIKKRNQKIKKNLQTEYKNERKNKVDVILKYNINSLSKQ